jgi:CelD/BcsL family acetyltransferase involved in cellulose biosynthesis
MLCGDVLLLRDRPVAIRLIYRNETSRWLFANAVNGGIDPEFRDHSPGGILLFRTIEYLEQEAGASNKTLRFSCGQNDANYKKLWCFEVPTYRL